MLNQIKKFFGLPVKEKKEPEEYVMGVSTGVQTAAMETLSQRVSKVSMKGATLLEVGISHSTSFTEHDKRELRTFQEQGDVELSAHGAVGQEWPITRTEKRAWETVQDDLEGYVEKADELGLNYIITHASGAWPSPEVVRAYALRRERMVGPKNDNLIDLIKEEARKDSKAIEWLAGSYYETRLSERGRIEAAARELSRKEDVDEGEALEEVHRLWRAGKTDKVKELAVEELKRTLSEREELLLDELRVYEFIAWCMYEEGDRIWTGICGDKSPEKLEEEGEMGKLVDAVAGKYIEGHIKKLEEKLKGKKVKLIFETPDCRDSRFRGYYKLVKPERIYHVIKAINNPKVKMCIDFDHLASHGFDPLEELEGSPRSLGREVEVLHIGGHPSPAHLHRPVEKGEIGLYKMIWELRKKGFKSGYWIFEMGGYEEEERWKRSVPNIKEMAMFLEDDLKPKDLPAEFYGYTDWEFKHDRAVVESHMFDPVKGLVEAPELRDTLLGTHAIREKRKAPEEWEREEHR